jgi:hypothetical protein
MGCEMSSQPNISKQKVSSYIQIYLVSSNEYAFYGIVPPDGEEFHLIFKKEDEERLPIAIAFEVSEMNHICNQYQMIQKCWNEEEIKKENMILDFNCSEFSNYYSCSITPRFPFAIEIYGKIHLRI